MRLPNGLPKIVLPFLLSLCAIGPAIEARAPQNAPALPPQTAANLEKIRDAALASDYAWRQVAHLTENIGPRLAGSPQAQAAVSYVADELGRLGLDVKLEKVMAPHWVRGEERAELTAYPGQAPGTTQKIVLTALGASSSTPPGGLTAEVIVVSNFDELTALSRDQVAGRIVLFNEKFDKRLAADGEGGTAYEQAAAYRRSGPRLAQALGAAAALVRSAGGADYRIPHTGASLPAGIPAAAVTAEDAELMAHLTAQGRLAMHLVLTPQTLPDVESANVVADLKGSEHPEEIVIVSGHLDSWDLGTGAIDDAAGVAVAMETAAVLKQLGLRPRRTVRVIAWMDEESRGSGSKAYAADYKSAMAEHIGALESDLGAGHPGGFVGNFSPAAAAALAPVLKFLQPTGATILRNTGDAAADIDPLADFGVPTFAPLQDARYYFNYHHTAADTLDKIDPRDLAENAAAMAVLAYALADMPQALPRSTAEK